MSEQVTAVKKRRELPDVKLPGEDRIKLELGVRIRTQRKKLGLTGRELSEKTGVSNTQISNIEYGRHFPGMKTYIVLCRELGIKDGVTRVQ